MSCAVACVLALLSDHTTWGGNSNATIRPGDACAVITLNNSTWDDLGTYERQIALGGLVVGLEATIGTGGEPDRVTATVPPGWLALPPSIDVPENRGAEMLICPAEGVGA